MSQVFSFHDHPIRTISENGQPWFVAIDIAKLLGYARPSKEVRRICKHVKLIKSVNLGSSGSQSTNLVSWRNSPHGLLLIPESDVWRLLTHSTLPKALEVEEWIMGEVLPSIRKTGKYEAKHEPKQESLPESTQKILPGDGPEWDGPKLMERLKVASAECYSVYEELCVTVAKQYDNLHKMEPAEVSGLSAMLCSIIAAKGAQKSLMHAYNQWVHTSTKRKGINPDAWDKHVAVTEINTCRIMLERMLGWDIPEGLLRRL